MSDDTMFLKCETCDDEISVDSDFWQDQLEDSGWEWDNSTGTIKAWCDTCSIKREED